MRKVIILSTLVFAGCFSACKKENTDSAIADKITGNWLVIAENNFSSDSGIVVEWGFYYVASVQINADNTFAIDRSPAPSGTWRLKDNGSTIEFDSNFIDINQVLTDTTSFKVSVNSKDELVLQKDGVTYRHRRL